MAGPLDNHKITTGKCNTCSHCIVSGNGRDAARQQDAMKLLSLISKMTKGCLVKYVKNNVGKVQRHMLAGIRIRFRDRVRANEEHDDDDQG